MFYTYVWKDSAGVPFYVGKGTRDRHKLLWGRSAEFDLIHGQGGCTVEIVDEFILESQAHAHEVELIERFGRREYGGLLVNKTDGGEGSSGTIVSIESRRRQSAARLGTKRSDETRAKMSAALKGRPLSAANKARLTGLKRSPETRARISAARTGLKVSPEGRANYAKSQRMRGPTKGEFKGVSFYRSNNKWTAHIKVDGGQRNIGLFATPAEAAQAYDAAAYEAWGDGCYLNFPENHRRAA